MNLTKNDTKMSGMFSNAPDFQNTTTYVHYFSTYASGLLLPIAFYMHCGLYGNYGGF